jgi:Rrf2 family protein
MRLLSDSSEYAMRAVVWLSDAAQRGTPHTTQAIAAGTQATPGYLTKVLQLLGRAGIVHAQRGIGGGFHLARDPNEITVYEVINAVDPIERIHTCPLNIKSHGKKLCPMHRRMDDAMAQIEAAFKKTTIAEILADPNKSKPLCEIAAGKK